MFGSDDQKGAAHHAQVAQGHSAQAKGQGAEASKKYAQKHSDQKQAE